MEKNYKILVLAMGNDIMGDDGVALEAAKQLSELYGDKITVEEMYGGGLELFDVVEGMDKVLIIDSITTGNYEPGTICEYSDKEFRKTIASSPHYIGLPEVINISKLLNLNFPTEIKILAVEILLQLNVKEGLSPEIRNSVPGLVDKAKLILDRWLKDEQ